MFPIGLYLFRNIDNLICKIKWDPYLPTRSEVELKSRGRTIKGKESNGQREGQKGQMDACKLALSLTLNGMIDKNMGSVPKCKSGFQG
ncbi:MAG: hypothetical protein QMC83_09200 [Thermodesulfovibrionales bacterium]|nr:hypothetical protein [Thermodesulfovibrionales bacterium]